MPGVAALTLLLVLGVASCAGGPPRAAVPDPTPAESSAPAAPSAVNSTTTDSFPTTTGSAGQPVAFVAVVDGDTVRTSAGTVRIIGIDAPERGECGHDEASLEIGRLVSVGDPVSLERPPGQNDRDRYDRLVRYVITAGGVDLGLMQLQAGHAIARYDSTDGYPHHPRQATYHAAQVAILGPDGLVVTTACRGAAQASIAPVVAGTNADDRWWELYSSCTKLKKNTHGHPTGPFRHDDPAQAAIYDWFAHGTGNRGDGDDDGLACE